MELHEKIGSSGPVRVMQDEYTRGAPRRARGPESAFLATFGTAHRRDDEQPEGYMTEVLSETALVAAGHSPEDAQRLVDAERAGTLCVALAPSLARIMGRR